MGSKSSRVSDSKDLQYTLEDLDPILSIYVFSLNNFDTKSPSVSTKRNRKFSKKSFSVTVFWGGLRDVHLLIPQLQNPWNALICDWISQISNFPHFVIQKSKQIRGFQGFRDSGINIWTSLLAFIKKYLYGDLHCGKNIV